MKYIKGFFMAWSCFTQIPCPYNKWHEEYRYHMLNMLPLVGLFLAVIMNSLWFVLSIFVDNSVFLGAVLTAAYFFATGFIHLDGYMDCSDAVLSRASSQEKRRILKDSHVGAFAVIALVFMVLIFSASMNIFVQEFSMGRAALLTIILMVSRQLAAYDIINRRPMAASQYVAMESYKNHEYGLPGIIITVAAGIVCYVAFLLDFSQIMSLGNLYNLIYTAVAVSGMKLAAGALGSSARKQLGGMNGDIAGYMIVAGELTGVGAVALMLGIGA
ncbi:MAG: adenosylcobinamide-GDP ribazoletransferase [Clostridiales bacterium]|nr:adenosylcobinamide-GDP ribazoletransferase [Clostridiales bacterium]